jgi:flagellar basal body L-ring protein FlgH
MLIVIGILIGQLITQKPSSIVLTDTITNTQVIEKIKTEIVEQEKEIVKYKTEYIYEKENAKNINDSAAVELFYRLASE